MTRSSPMSHRRGPARAPGALVLLGATACGGGAPLLHTAHPLPAGELSFAAGASSQLAFDAASEPMPDADAARPGNPDAIARRAFIAPGLSPVGAGRLGLEYDSEVGLTFTGRSLRVDGRHVFLFDRLALSTGLGLSSILARRSEAEARDGGGVLGFGLDVPILFGWQSRADVVGVWAGLRLGYENLGNFGPPGETAPGDPAPLESVADAYQLEGGGLVGLRVGMPPVWVHVELRGNHHWVWASERTADAAGGPESEVRVDFQTFSLAPAGALVVRF